MPTPSAPQPFDTINGADVTPEEVRWLWHPYIPFGKLTIIEGNPGLGKSWITCDIASRLSRGLPLPLQEVPNPPCRVLFLSAEDGLEDTIAPRLIKCGAAMDKMYFPRGRFTLDAENIKRLEATMRQVAATMVFIDPIQSYFGTGRDMNKMNDVRAFMDALTDVAQRTQSALVLIRHLRKEGKKDEGGDPLFRGHGSIDWIGAARSALQATRLKSNEKVLSHIKSSCAKEGPSLGFEVGEDGLSWTGVKAQELVELAGQRTSKGAEVVTWLTDFLDSRQRPAQEVIESAIRAGFTKSTLVKVKGQVAKSVKIGDHWHWALRDSVQADVDLGRDRHGGTA